MPTMTEFTEAAQEQTLAAVKQSQQLVVDAVRAWAVAVEKAVPELPASPLVDELPAPEELVRSSFDFAERMLKAQREFAEQVVAAVAPVLKATKPVGTE